MDWPIAINEYDPSAIYSLDDSANPTQIVVWSSDRDEPTIADLEAAFAAWQAKNPDPPDWDGLLAEAILSPLYQHFQTVSAADGETSQIFSSLKLIMTSDKLQSPDFLAKYIQLIAAHLDAIGQPITQDMRSWWNDRMTAYNFSEACKLITVSSS